MAVIKRRGRLRERDKCLLRTHKHVLPGPTADRAARPASTEPPNSCLNKAKALCRYWPDVEVGDRLFV